MNATNLRTKFMISAAFLITLLGLTVLTVITLFYRQELSTEFGHKGLFASRLMALHLVDPIVTDNIAGLNQIIRNVKEADKDISYVFVVNQSGDKIIAHTFTQDFPTDLLKANPLLPEQDYVIRLVDTEQGIIQDIAMPVLG